MKEQEDKKSATALRLMAQQETKGDVMENSNNTVLNQIQEGESVCDSAGNKIGKVRRVYLGAMADRTKQPGSAPATTPEPNLRNETLFDDLAKGLTDNPMPEVLRERLLEEGYIQIDTGGLFASDRFALPDQIESVREDCVQLRLSKNDLLER